MAAVTSLFNRRKFRVRKAIKAKANGRPRLVVSRSNQHIYAQLIDDSISSTICQASTKDKELDSLKNRSNKEAAAKVGALIAKRAVEAKVEHVVFDRGGYIYHGRVKALADAARENGLSF